MTKIITISLHRLIENYGAKKQSYFLSLFCPIWKWVNEDIYFSSIMNILLQGGRLHSTFSNCETVVTWYPALVRLVASVSPDVLLEMWELGELALTYFTSVGLDAEMDPGVLREVGAVGEGLAAVTALVWFRLPHVNLSVKLQVGFGTESLKQES